MVAAANGSNPPHASLRVLELESCNKIDDVVPLSSLSGLRKLELLEMKRIESLVPISGLVELEELRTPEQ